MRDLIDVLTGQTPEDSTGMFRFLHNSYFMRNLQSIVYTGPPATPDLRTWQQIEAMVIEIPYIQPDLLDGLLREAERHSWTMGRASALHLADQLWPHLSPEARARVIAGATEAVTSRDQPADPIFAWIHSKLASDALAFDGDSAAGAGCNAIAAKQLGLLAHILRSAGQWAGDPVDRRDPFEKRADGRWSGELAPLSTRAIDRCLEAAVILGSAEAARMCLDAGADPNIPIWALDRSYNERYCALSFAISKWPDPKGRHGDGDLVQTLLEGGANPGGIGYGGRQKPLYIAIEKRDWDLAETLLQQDATLNGDHSPEFGTTTSEPTPGNLDFGYRPEDLQWAEREIGSLVPLKSVTAIPHFYRGHCQGGERRRLLSGFFRGDHVEPLRRLGASSLPLDLAPHDLVDAIEAKAWQCLQYLLEHHQAPPEAFVRIRSHAPDFPPD